MNRVEKREDFNLKAREGVEAIEASAFEHIGADVLESEHISRPTTSYWKDAMGRLFKNKAAVVCRVILGIIFVGAVIVPMISPFTISEQSVLDANQTFMFKNTKTGKAHIFGTDTLGRDIFVRIWHGARTSLFIAFAAVFVNLMIGLIYGGISGYIGGWVDNLMMRIIEIINGIPYLMIVILLMMVLEPGIGTIIVAYAAVGWTGMARLVRGQVMGLKEQEYVIAARTMGASPMRIICRHLIPNTLSVVIVNITLAIPAVIFTEAFLSFIGLGVPIPNASWGTLANEGIRVFQQYPYQLILPAIFISVTMLSFNLLGDALRDAFDPKLRR